MLLEWITFVADTLTVCASACLVGKWNCHIEVGTGCKNTTGKRPQASSWDDTDCWAETWHSTRRSDSSLLWIVSIMELV